MVAVIILGKCQGTGIPFEFRLRTGVWVAIDCIGMFSALWFASWPKAFWSCSSSLRPLRRLSCGGSFAHSMAILLIAAVSFYSAQWSYKRSLIYLIQDNAVHSCAQILYRCLVYWPIHACFSLGQTWCWCSFCHRFQARLVHLICFWRMSIEFQVRLSFCLYSPLASLRNLKVHPQRSV